MPDRDNHTPVKKSRLIDSRDTSTEVVWTESESEEAEAKTTKLTIEVSDIFLKVMSIRV